MQILYFALTDLISKSDNHRTAAFESSVAAYTGLHRKK